MIYVPPRRAHWKPPVQLGSNATRVVLKRAVTAVCAHAGFDGEPVYSLYCGAKMFLFRSCSALQFLDHFCFLCTPRMSVNVGYRFHLKKPVDALRGH